MKSFNESVEVNRKKAEAIDEANKKAAESLATYEASVKAGATQWVDTHGSAIRSRFGWFPPNLYKH